MDIAVVASSSQTDRVFPIRAYVAASSGLISRVGIETPAHFLLVNNVVAH